MDGAVACTYVEPLCMKTNEHYYTVIRMITDAKRTIEHVTARAVEISDGCSHSFHKPHNIGSRCSSQGGGKGSSVLALRDIRCSFPPC